jgi:hypothetical protein
VCKALTHDALAVQLLLGAVGCMTRDAARSVDASGTRCATSGSTCSKKGVCVCGVCYDKQQS